MSRRLLIVDDSPVMRSFIRRTIQIACPGEQEYCEASNGQEALAALEHVAVDLILTDINMPVMDGAQLIRRLKSDKRYCVIPVVVVSTDATHHRMEELLGLGAAGYLTKPFSPERLAAVLEGGSHP